MFSRRFLLALAALALLSVSAPLRAQEVPLGTTADMSSALEKMCYDPRERGPLLVVAPPSTFFIKRLLPAPSEPGATPLMLADAFDRRVFKAGAVTVIAPREMTIINPKPGKPSPLLDLSPKARLSAFLGTLSNAQWQIIGADGLSRDVLTDDQAALTEGLWPRITAVRQARVKVDGSKPYNPDYQGEGEPLPVDASRLRLRLSRVATFTFNQPGNNKVDYIMGVGRLPRDGDTVWNPEDPTPPSDRSRAFGVALRQVVAARLKRGELDFAASALDASVPLDATDAAPLKTVEDLLGRVRKVTGLDIRADKRVGGLPVYLRTVPGQTARSGDVLMALAYGVTGAYRRLGPRLFLLTDDVEGIGTRFARLRDWADAAGYERDEAIKRLTSGAARHSPLGRVPFSAGYNALPPELADKIEAVWSKRTDTRLEISLAQLPASVRQDADDTRKIWDTAKEPPKLNRDKVKIGMGVVVQWMLPDGGHLDTGLGLDEVDAQFLAPGPEPAANSAAPAASRVPSTVFDKVLIRRAVAVAPKAPVEATQLVETAANRGFTEVWVRQTPGGDTSALQAAIRAGSRLQVPVWVMPALLEGTVGEPERTLSGQTGDEWAATFVSHPRHASNADFRAVADGQADAVRSWRYPVTDADENALQQQIAMLADLPGIGGLCLTHTTPPGYLRTRGGLPSGGPLGGDLGYTLTARLRFLDQEGYDPVDLTEADGMFEIDRNLPFFPITPPAFDLWNRFRDEQVRARLGRIYQSVRAPRPTLPLYIEDRTSTFARYFPVEVGWYGQWDKADRLPINPILASRNEGIAAARVASDVRLLRVRWDRGGQRAENPAQFADAVRTATKQAVATPGMWQGLAVDLTDFAAPDALRLLGAIPARSAAKTAGK